MSELDPTGKWCYSLDEEAYHGRFDTAIEAHQAAINHEALDGNEAPETYWVGNCCHPLDLIKGQIGDDIMEMIECRLIDEIGHEDACLNISKQDEIDLSNLVMNFIRERAKVQYYGVGNVTKHNSAEFEVQS